MPKRVSVTGTDADTLRALLKNGADSEVLRARVDWAEVEGLARYVRPLVACKHCGHSHEEHADRDL